LQLCRSGKEFRRRRSSKLEGQFTKRCVESVKQIKGPVEPGPKKQHWPNRELARTKERRVESGERGSTWQIEERPDDQGAVTTLP
ncbi:hypothetical protein L195_g060501, partial [Trifolium pratense]